MSGPIRSRFPIVHRLTSLIATAGVFAVSVGNEGHVPGAAERRVASAADHSGDGDPVSPLLRSRELAISRAATLPCPVDWASPPAEDFFGVAPGRGFARDHVGPPPRPHLRSRLCVWQV